MKTPEVSPVLEKLYAAIDNNEIPLPAMPDLAIKIQDMLKDINISNQKIAQTVATDPVLVSQVMKAANSALYFGKPKVETVIAAVSRIGFQMLRNIVIAFTMNKISNSTHPLVKKHIAEFWEHSREVAAISYVLTTNEKHLNQDQAMMAGLVHDIGTLPLCLYAEKMVPQLDESILGALAMQFKASVGDKLLQDWQFPSEIIDVVLGHENLQRDTGSGVANYTDIVTLANILDPATAKTTDWDSIVALKRLHFSKETCQEFFAIFDNQLRAAREMLK